MFFTGQIQWNNYPSCYVVFDKEICRYYRRLYEYSRYKTIKLTAPSRGSHITITTDGVNVDPRVFGTINCELTFNIIGFNVFSKPKHNVVCAIVGGYDIYWLRRQLTTQEFEVQPHFAIGYYESL